jgi:hypothetical protein
VELKMPNYDSPLGSKRFAGQPMKEYDIPDETGHPYQNVEHNNMDPVMRHRGPSMHGSQVPVDVNAAMAFQNRLQSESFPEDNDMEIERQIRVAREAKRTGKERLNDGAKRRIEMLIGMTRSSRQVDLEGNVFVLQTLLGKEMRDAITAAAEYDGTVQSPFEIRKQLLARSLIQVAGVDTAQFVGSNSLEAKLELIDDLPEALLGRLYDEYLLLAKESRDKFAIKSVEDAKEVSEDLKK